MFTAGATAVGSIAPDLLRDQVMSHILKNERWTSTIGAAFTGGTSVGSLYATSYLTYPCVVTELGITNRIGLALAAEAVDSYSSTP